MLPGEGVVVFRSLKRELPSILTSHLDVHYWPNSCSSTAHPSSLSSSGDQRIPNRFMFLSSSFFLRFPCVFSLSLSLYSFDSFRIILWFFVKITWLLSSSSSLCFFFSIHTKKNRYFQINYIYFFNIWVLYGFPWRISL